MPDKAISAAIKTAGVGVISEQTSFKKASLEQKVESLVEASLANVTSGSVSLTPQTGSKRRQKA